MGFGCCDIVDYWGMKECKVRMNDKCEQQWNEKGCGGKVLNAWKSGKTVQVMTAGGFALEQQLSEKKNRHRFLYAWHLDIFHRNNTHSHQAG